MRQASLNLQIDYNTFVGPPVTVTLIEVFCGLTPWAKTLEHQPPFLGWWRCWNEQGRAERRWWNGHVWSIPCPLGISSETANSLTSTASRRDSEAVLWSGLCRPHLAGYMEYTLVKSPRTVQWDELHGAKA